MKLVYCIPMLYNSGGMERVLTQKANYLINQPDTQIMIVTTEVAPEGTPVCYFPLDKRIQLIQLNLDFNADFQFSILHKWMNHRRKQRKYKKQLRQILMDEQADACISLCGKEIEWLCTLDVPCRKLAEIHFAMDYRKQLLMQYHRGPLWAWIGNRMTRQLVQNCKRLDQLVVLTEADRQQWQANGVRRVSCIINPSSIEPNQDGLHDKLQVLAVGRLHPQKGFDILLRVWNRVIQKHPDYTLKIVGEGPMRAELEQEIQELGLSCSVEMNGTSVDLKQDYGESPFLVLSSRFEGLPLVLIEAMSCGCCCIAFDCPQGPAELLENGKTGRLVPYMNEDALYTTIIEHIEQPEESRQMGKNAYEYAQTHFALEPIMQQWIELLQDR